MDEISPQNQPTCPVRSPFKVDGEGAGEAAEAAASAARGAALGRSFRRVAARPARLLAHVAQIQMPTSKRASRSTSASFQPPQARSGPHSCTPRVSALKSVRSRRLAELRILFLVHLHRFIALI